MNAALPSKGINGELKRDEIKHCTMRMAESKETRTRSITHKQDKTRQGSLLTRYTERLSDGVEGGTPRDLPWGAVDEDEAQLLLKIDELEGEESTDEYLLLVPSWRVPLVITFSVSVDRRK